MFAVIDSWRLESRRQSRKSFVGMGGYGLMKRGYGVSERRSLGSADPLRAVCCSADDKVPRHRQGRWDHCPEGAAFLGESALSQSATAMHRASGGLNNSR